MALLIAPLFTAGIAIGGIQNANAGEEEENGVDISCEFTEGTGTAEVTLSLGEESGTINKSIRCEEIDYLDPEEIISVSPAGVLECTNSVPIGTIIPSFSGLIISGATATWIETIILSSDPGVASFDCVIKFVVETESGDARIALFQTVTINFVPRSLPIGGTVGSMDTVSLLVAGAQANMGLWSLALVGMVAAGAAITYKLKSNKTNKETL